MLLLAGSAALPACNGPISPQARDLLQNGLDTYNRGDDRATLERMNEFIDQHGEGPGADEAYYLRGLSRYRTGDRDGAEKDLRQALDRTARKDLRIGALKALGDLSYDNGQMSGAEDFYNKALDIQPHAEHPADEIFYRLGCALQRMGRWRDADVPFSRLNYYFEGSDLAQRADQRVFSRAWMVQAGAFRAGANARNVRDKLLKRNFPVEAKPSIIEGNLHYLVLVGRYTRYKQASQICSRVRRIVDGAFVTTTR